MERSILGIQYSRPSLVDIGGMIGKWIIIDLAILPRQSHVRRFYSTKLRRHVKAICIAALALSKSDWDQVPHTFHEVI